ncbi:MAG: ABC transporter permease [Vicinamibacteria bacterium]
MKELRFAFRALLKTPVVALIAIASLALGIGANSATFSILYQILLEPLPVAAPERLANLSAPGPKPGMQSCSRAGDCEVVFSYPMFRDLEAEPSGFTGIAAHRSFGANLAFRGQTSSGEGTLVSGGYFPVLDLTPALGRLLGPEDDRTLGGDFVVVLSHAYWRTRFDASRDVLGEAITVNGQPMTIVGVTPAGFHGTVLGERPDVYVPLTMHGRMVPSWNERFVEDRRAYWLYLFARLEPGTPRESALAAINARYQPIVQEVEVPLQEGMSDATMERFLAKTVEVEDGRRGQSSLHRDVRAPALLLFVVTGVVLLIACANVANLLLARAASRAGEMVVRVSIGATRSHLLRQLLAESLLLAAAGGLAGLLVSRSTLALIARLLPPEALPLRLELIPVVVLFAAALSLGTAVVFGVIPALHGTRPDLAVALRGEAGRSSDGRAASRFRASLVTGQMALATTLLISAGLFTRSLLNVSRVDLGMDASGLTVFTLSPELSDYTPSESRALFERIEDELSAIPGVTGVTSALVPLLTGSNWGTGVWVEGFERGPDTDADSRFNDIGPDYFRTLGVPLLAGREFTRADSASFPKVAIVNEAFARKFHIEEDPIGRRMNDGGSPEEETLDVEIVGLVPDTKYSEVKQDPPPLFFRPYRQNHRLGFLTFYVRGALPPEELMPAIRDSVKRLDPNLPIENLKTMTEQVRENVYVDRMISTLSGAFAALATLLAAVGLYGVLAYNVARRTREIGLRMALGADGSRLRRMVLKQVGGMALVGGVIGIVAALGLGRLARSLLFEVEGHDPLVLLASVALLAAMALAAGFVPALTASRIDPMRALRYE